MSTRHAKGGRMKLWFLIVGTIAGMVVFAGLALAGGSPKTKLVSRANNGDPGTGGYSAVGGITPNGRWVSMESAAENFPGAGTDEDQVYVRDRKRGRTILVSRANNGDPADGG